MNQLSKGSPEKRINGKCPACQVFIPSKQDCFDDRAVYAATLKNCMCDFAFMSLLDIQANVS